MSEEKIQLPDFLIADLYKHHLVDIESSNLELNPTVSKEKVTISKVAAIQTETIRFLGENGKGIIIIVNQPEAAFLIEEDLSFLVNILRACQFNLNDIAIINQAKQKTNYEMMKSELNVSTILLFEVDPSAIKLPFLIPPFQVQNFDERRIMLCPALHKINQATQDGKLLKTKLWISLKKVFDIA